MKSKELKILIRSMVRECVHELLAEKFIEKSLLEIAGTKQKPIKEQVEPVANTPKRVPKISRQEMASKYGFEEDSPMLSLFEDTLQTNPVINGEGIDPPGTVSEKGMERSGIMSKDWSKYF